MPRFIAHPSYQIDRPPATFVVELFQPGGVNPDPPFNVLPGKWWAASGPLQIKGLCQYMWSHAADPRSLRVWTIDGKLLAGTHSASGWFDLFDCYSLAPWSSYKNFKL